MLREHTVLTDAALDAARQLGVRLVEGSATSPGAARRRRGAGAAGDAGRAAGAGAGGAHPRAPPPAGRPGRSVAGIARRRRRSGRDRSRASPTASLQTQLLIDGEWSDAAGGETVPTIDPATNQHDRRRRRGRARGRRPRGRAARAAPPRLARPRPREAVAHPASGRGAHRGRAGPAARDRVARRRASRSARRRSSTCRPAGILGVSIRGSCARSTAAFSRCRKASLDYVRKEPMGVVGMIIPWNFPLHIACRKGSARSRPGTRSS